MTLEGKNIYIVSPEPWGINRLSKHHYAEELAKKNRVFFIQCSEKEGETVIHEQLSVIDYKPIKGLRRLPKKIRNGMMRRSWNSIHARTKVQPDVVWSFDNSMLFNLSESGAQVNIAHIVDLNQDFNFEEHASSADLALGTTPYIVSKLREFNPKTHFSGHGCIPRSSRPSDEEQVTVSYLGNVLLNYVHRETIKKLIASYPDIQFRMIGPIGASNLTGTVSLDDEAYLNELKTAKNCTLVGEVAQEDLNDELAKAHMYIIAYDLVHREQVANPHKTLELLSTGKPVLTYTLDAYENHPYLIQVTDLDSYITEFEQLVANKSDFQINEEQIAEALKRTYSECIKNVEQWLS